MSFNKLTSIVCRVFFVVAFVLVGIAVLEKVVNLAGYTVLRGFLGFYTPGRMLEFAGILSILVAVLLLREIREQLKGIK